MACFTLPKDWKVVCPANWNAIKKKPKKYKFSICAPVFTRAVSPENTAISCWGTSMTTIQAKTV